MTFSLALDLIMTFLLAGTIYFAWKLSEQIARFRNSRGEMERLIRDLNGAVDRAQQSIQGLRMTADTSGQDLHKVMRSATELCDELQIMTESANSLATRLERAVSGGNNAHFEAPQPRAQNRPETPAAFPGFSIRDPEFDGTVTPDVAPVNWRAADEDDDLQSQAEKDLRRALAASQKPTRQGI